MCTVKTALLSVLALASAEILLAPEDVPLECASICGPVVELTSKCSLGTLAPDPEVETVARVKKRKVERRERGHTQFHDKRVRWKRTVVTNALGQVVSVPPGMGNGQAFTVTTVVTVTAAPSPSKTPENQFSVTTLPAKAASPIWTVMTTTMTMVAPEALPTDDGVAPTTTPLVVGNAADEEFGYAEREEAVNAVEDAERECVCQNDSFDLELVSGLCSSCLMQSVFSPATMETVMTQCNFSEREYTPRSDSVVDNLRVSAERPDIPEGAEFTLINDSPPSPGLGTGVTGALAAVVACGVALLF